MAPRRWKKISWGSVAEPLLVVKTGGSQRGASGKARAEGAKVQAGSPSSSQRLAVDVRGYRSPRRVQDRSICPPRACDARWSNHTNANLVTDVSTRGETPRIGKWDAEQRFPQAPSEQMTEECNTNAGQSISWHTRADHARLSQTRAHKGKVKQSMAHWSSKAPTHTQPHLNPKVPKLFLLLLIRLQPLRRRRRG